MIRTHFLSAARRVVGFLCERTPAVVTCSPLTLRAFDAAYDFAHPYEDPRIAEMQAKIAEIMSRPGTLRAFNAALIEDDEFDYPDEDNESQPYEAYCALYGGRIDGVK